MFERFGLKRLLYNVHIECAEHYRQCRSATVQYEVQIRNDLIHIRRTY